MRTRHMCSRRCSVGHDALFDEGHPLIPEQAVGGVEQHDRGRVGLTGVEQGQDLEELVHRAETTGQDDEGDRRSRQGDLAGEEVLHRHELVSASM
jgi:hypothetical protein